MVLGQAKPVWPYLENHCQVQVAAGAQPLDGLAGFSDGDLQVDSQVLPRGILQDPRQDKGGEAGEDPQAQFLVGGILGFGGGSHERLDVREHLGGVPGHHDGGFRGQHAAR
jgi:hypothetical protein